MKFSIIFIPFLMLQCSTAKDQLKRSNFSKFGKIMDHSIRLPLDNTKEVVFLVQMECAFANPFTDSTSIGERGMYKIEIEAVHLTDFEDSLYLHLFKKKNGDWVSLQQLSKYSDVMAYFSPNFEDFNNDGWNDLTLWTGDAARGANEIRTLFIFDPKKERLITVSNSENYPNLEYNKALDCIDAWLVYGGSSTIFLTLKGDSLIEFASVEHDDLSRDVYLIDEKGNRNLLESTQPKEYCFTRYCNYAPVEICGE